MKLSNAIQNFDYILTECSVIERIKRTYFFPLDNYIQNASLLYDPKGLEVLRNIYDSYIETIDSNNSPLILLTPTWRANPERIKCSDYKNNSVIKDSVNFMKNIRSSYDKMYNQIILGGLIGCKNDAYKPSESLSEKEAELFHRIQLLELINNDVDFIMVSTLPALTEALGISRILSEHKFEYVLSFVIKPDGNILDGTPLINAIDIIDNSINYPPLFYMINCVHPVNVIKAFNQQNFNKKPLKRIKGLQANSSIKSPEELDESLNLQEDNLTEWIDAMITLHDKYNLKVLGGCCGTNEIYLKSLSDALGDHYVRKNHN